MQTSGYQFGKPVATFQAVAQHLVRLMSETQLALMAFHVAVAAGSRHGLEAAEWEVAAFKAVAGESADEVTARAHQVHAAIGMTQEYSLHQITRRLWAWRQEFGSTTASRRQVGALLGAGGAANAWPTIVAGTAAG